MVDQRRAQATQFLARARSGEPGAAEQLTPLVYRELRDLAAAFLRQERAGHTLQPTALVHEAYLRLVDATGLGAIDQSHFVAIAARSMRRVLVEHARAKDAEKRGGGARPVQLETHCAIVDGPDIDLLALDEALTRLEALDPRHARVVELRYFGGLSMEEVAALLAVSKRTVELDWTLARAFLRRELAGEK